MRPAFSCFFSCEAASECEANPAGGSPERATGRQSPLLPAGRLPSQQASLTMGRRLDWPRFYRRSLDRGS